MIEILLIIIAVLLLVNIFLTLKTSGKDSGKPLHEIKDAINVFDNSLGKVDKSIKDDFQRNREESNKIAKENREEVANSLKSFSSTFTDNVKDFNQLQKQKFDDLALKQSELTKTTEQKQARSDLEQSGFPRSFPPAYHPDHKIDPEGEGRYRNHRWSERVRVLREDSYRKKKE